MKAVARGRVSSGDIQAMRIKIRTSLDPKSKEFGEFEAIASEEWNLIMVIYREVSEQIADAHRQVERVVRLIGESAPEAKSSADQMASKFDQDKKNLVSKYMK